MFFEFDTLDQDSLPERATPKRRAAAYRVSFEMSSEPDDSDTDQNWKPSPENSSSKMDCDGADYYAGFDPLFCSEEKLEIQEAVKMKPKHQSGAADATFYVEPELMVQVEKPAPASQLMQKPAPASQIMQTPVEKPAPASQLMQTQVKRPAPASQLMKKPAPASQLMQKPAPASQIMQTQVEKPAPASQLMKKPAPASQLMQTQVKRPAPASQLMQKPAPASQLMQTQVEKAVPASQLMKKPAPASQLMQTQVEKPAPARTLMQTLKKKKSYLRIGDKVVAKRMRGKGDWLPAEISSKLKGGSIVQVRFVEDGAFMFVSKEDVQLVL